MEALILAAAVAAIEGQGDMHGVEEWLLLRSHWSSSFNNSAAVGPPDTWIAVIVYYRESVMG